MFLRPGTPIGRINFIVRSLIGWAVVILDAVIIVAWVSEMSGTPEIDTLGTEWLVYAACVVLSLLVAGAFIENAAAARCVDLGLSRNIYLFGRRNRREAVLLQLIFAPGKRR